MSQWPALPECGGGVLVGGDTGECEPATAGLPSTRAFGFVGTGWLVRLVSADGTLLGPEGTTFVVGISELPGMTWPSIPSRRAGPVWVVFLWVWWGAVGVVGWLLVENCTVDASILFSVVKLSRANGGCLGTRSR